MKPFFVFFVLSIFCIAPSFAVDQVTLTTGELLEGKVLSDVPNRHVDLQLLNGEKRRYPKSQVLSVERDVPSNKDREMYATDRQIFVGPLAGGLVSTTGGDVEFFWGVKLGFNAANLGGALFAPAIVFKRYATTVQTVSASLNWVNAQFLFRRIGNSGFYAGPQLGLAIASISAGGTSLSDTAFSGGAAVGYDFQFSDSFSLGPDVQYDHSFDTGNGVVTFGLAALFHFE